MIVPLLEAVVLLVPLFEPLFCWVDTVSPQPVNIIIATMKRLMLMVLAQL